MSSVGPRARNRERGPDVVLAPPSFFHPRVLTLRSADGFASLRSARRR